MRLDKFLTTINYCSRSEAKKLAKQGRIKVNNVVVLKNDYKLNFADYRLLDKVSVDDKELAYSKYEYYMLNKPAGTVSSTSDKLSQTVVDLIDSSKKDLFPVGRLDKDTEGLLIITNDGELSHNLLSPRKHIDKRYFAKIEGNVQDVHITAFKEGIIIPDKNHNEEPVKLKPALLEIVKVYGNESVFSEVYVTISEGKYHQIKRMFKAIGMKVVYLKRMQMGSLMLDDELEPGEYRVLTNEELEALKKA